MAQIQRSQIESHKSKYQKTVKNPSVWAVFLLQYQNFVLIYHTRGTLMARMFIEYGRKILVLEGSADGAYVGKTYLSVPDMPDDIRMEYIAQRVIKSMRNKLFDDSVSVLRANIEKIIDNKMSKQK